jgi:hypothetical protein
LVADPHSILARWRNYFSQLLNVHVVSDARQTVIHTAEPLVPAPEMGGTCSADGESKDVYRIFVGKPEGKRPMGRPRRRWEDNIRMGLQEV